MKKKMPAQIITVCDICERQATFLEKCKACGKEYCLLCNSCIPGCVHQVDVCRKCAGREDVNNIVKKYVPRLRRILDKRDKELEGLNQ